MKALRRCSLFTILCLVAFTDRAGTGLPIDATSGEIVFKQSFKLHANYTDNDVYNLVQNWFADPGKFICQNGECSAVPGKNKTTVEEEFSNKQPLQSLDPASGRMTGKGLIKYFGAPSSNISLLYMEYYVVVEVKNHQLTATISKIKYHHYNRQTYLVKPIYKWQGGKPLDSADKFENLLNGNLDNKEVDQLTAFVNQNMEQLFTDLRGFLKTQKLLDANR